MLLFRMKNGPKNYFTDPINDLQLKYGIWFDFDRHYEFVSDLGTFVQLAYVVKTFQNERYVRTCPQTTLWHN